jgi:hypothetical protein
MVRIRSALAAAGVALALLAGCSGDDQASPTSTSAPVATGPTTTIRPVDTSFTGQNSAQFCTLAKTYNDRFSNFSTASTPSQLRTVTQEGRTAITQAATAAPAEIKPDVQVIANAFTALFDELEKVNFDINKLSPTSLGSLQAPEFQASTTRFQAYLRSVCGIAR